MQRLLSAVLVLTLMGCDVGETSEETAASAGGNPEVGAGAPASRAAAGSGPMSAAGAGGATAGTGGIPAAGVGGNPNLSDCKYLIPTGPCSSPTQRCYSPPDFAPAPACLCDTAKDMWVCYL
jgi:hypothetical protein